VLHAAGVFVSAAAPWPADLPAYCPHLRHQPLGIVMRHLIVAAAVLGLAACTQETQNEIGRAVQNWTGTNGVLEIYAGPQLVRRFLDIDKLSTAYGTKDGQPRPYRFGYGVLDENLNGQRDPGEKRVYFEVSDYSTPYVFYENPH
jgi:hypothetical protein